MIRRAIAPFIGAIGAVTPAAAQSYGDGHMGGWNWNDGWSHMFGGGLVMILFWILVIAAVVWLVLAIVRRSGGSGDQWERSALEVLDQRYARGEIDRDDYEARRADLLREKQ